MPRPTKQGLDYFPLDVHLDDKFALIEAEFGLTGFAVVVKLFQKIYGECGYYCEWTDEVALLFSHKIGLGGKVVSEIVSASVRRGIFDKGLLEKYQILTSNGIQKRYLEAVNRRKQIKIKSDYLLINCADFSENDSKNRINVDNNAQNECNNLQRKVKESKVNKSKVKESICAPDDTKIERVLSIYERIGGARPKEITGVVQRNIVINVNNGIDFYDVFNKVAKSTFLRESPWCTFDWVVRPDNVKKILSGRYDDKPKKQSEERRTTSYNLAEIEAFDEFK